MKPTLSLAFLILSSIYTPCLLAQKKGDNIHLFDPAPFADATHHWYDIAEPTNIIQPRINQPRFKLTDLEGIADNILLYQKTNGGWPKNYDMMAILTEAQKDSLIQRKDDTHTTFDNGTTYTHVEALCKAYTALGKGSYKDAALNGIDFILAAQYDNGGWPQYYPLENNYSRHITFNDGAYIGIMQLLKDILDGGSVYSFIDSKYRTRIARSFAKGLDCIIKTQIIDNGKLTAWCQQYDEESLQPAWARTFEPPSICNGESSDLVLFLMSMNHPSPEVINAIQNAVSWFSESRIYHIRVKVVPAEELKTAYRVSNTDRIILEDPQAPPIWTRYYELKTHRPLFCGRNYKLVYSLAEVERERRDGYGWYTYEPQKVLDQYALWQKKWAPDHNILLDNKRA